MPVVPRQSWNSLFGSLKLCSSIKGIKSSHLPFPSWKTQPNSPIATYVQQFQFLTKWQLSISFCNTFCGLADLQGITSISALISLFFSLCGVSLNLSSMSFSASDTVYSFICLSLMCCRCSYAICRCFLFGKLPHRIMHSDSWRGTQESSSPTPYRAKVLLFIFHKQ